MKKVISFSASMEIDMDNYEDWNPETFYDVESGLYDSVGRPLSKLQDEGWTISNKKIENIEVYKGCQQ